MTFRSAATTYGERVAGLLLSGMPDDGASGLWEIARHGGVTIVQDPSEAAYPSMPETAAQRVPVDYMMSVEDMPMLHTKLVNGGNAVRNGPKFQSQEDPQRHFFSLKTLMDERTSAQERKLYEAVLALEEGALLAEHAQEKIDEPRRGALQKEAAQLREHAAAVRKLLEERVVPPLD